MGLLNRFNKRNANAINPSKFGRNNKFEKVYDHTSVSSERMQLFYKGFIPGRNEGIIYQFSVIRIVSHFRIPSLPPAKETHEFSCVYRDLEGIFKILFNYKFNCRLCNRDPDQVSKQIAEFLARLLLDSVNSPIGINALVLGQQSIDFWLQAFERRVVQLIETYSQNDTNRQL